MSRGTQAAESYGFEAIDGVLADPFPPGFDPATVRLPSIPKLRSAEDDEAHHREYWRAHVWAALHVYRRAFEDPACPPSLQADYARVAEEASNLVGRATGTYPISPLDSVACHAALKELLFGARALERTVVALRGVPDVLPADPPAGELLVVDGTDDTAPDDGPAGPPDPMELPEARAPTGVHGPDFFAAVAPPRGFEFKLSLRGARGLKRGRALGGGFPPEDHPST
jgi:hypothetical protein